MANSVIRVLDLPGHVQALLSALTQLWRYRTLTLEMTKRDLLDRYAGSAFGAVWTFLSPLLISGANLLAYLYIFRIRLHPGDTGAGYAAFVLSGMAAWMAFSDAVGRASSVIASNGNLVKQIVFPSEVLPVKLAIASVPTLLITAALVVGVAAFTGNGSIFGLLILFPIAFVLFMTFLTGCCYLLAAIGVYFRDLKDIVGVLLSAGLFLHPIFYPPEAVPPWMANVFLASPLSYFIWCFRDALYYGAVTHLWVWAVAPVWSALSLAIGWRTFRALRPSFGNVL